MPTVSVNSLIPFAIALVRYGIVFVLARFGMTGVVSDDNVTKVASGFVTLGLMLYGSYRAYRLNEDKKALNTLPPGSAKMTNL